MADFEFYQTEYKGAAIPDEPSFRVLAREADAQLNRYKRIYTVTGNKWARSMAVCAMAEALYGFQSAQAGAVVASSTVGSVSTTFKVADVDVSPRAQSRELLRCASLYLDIKRGCGA